MAATIPFIERQLFDEDEVTMIIDEALKGAMPSEDGGLVSPSDILIAVSTAIRDAIFSITDDEFENVTTYAIM